MRHRAENRYSLVDGTLVTRADVLGNDEHTQISGGLGSLTGRVWIDGRSVKGRHGPSMKVRWTDAATPLERSGNGRRGGMGTRVDRLLHHLEEVRDGEGKGSETTARVSWSTAVTRKVKESARSRTFVLRLRECLRVRFWIVQEEEVLE